MYESMANAHPIANGAQKSPAVTSSLILGSGIATSFDLAHWRNCSSLNTAAVSSLPLRAISGIACVESSNVSGCIGSHVASNRTESSRFLDQIEQPDGVISALESFIRLTGQAAQKVVQRDVVGLFTKGLQQTLLVAKYDLIVTRLQVGASSHGLDASLP